MNEIKIDNNSLFIGNNQITFEDKIMEVKIDGDKIFVLLHITPRKKLDYDDCHNIYCYNNHGEKIWQIGQRPNGDDTVFISIDLVDSMLYANDFLGRRFLVNKESGKIEKMYITK
ncbi:hypothetical protein [Geobacillus icigianus]|uniref:Uncharacterized protein n=1 Tax=Geobacillus icigianus TaxID=1430331 RepID=A0ABU6BGX5_9BACL|nr:hypothetical protein [Geobacillus icigianus]MEB3751168.1 hypothetical protein [Geobacillus icigianus]